MADWGGYAGKLVNRVGSKAGGQWWDYLIGAMQGVGDILIDKYEVEPEREKQRKLQEKMNGGGIIQSARQIPRMSGRY